MADHTGIEWCDATWNPVRARHRATGKVGSYCARVSGGCRFCYAEGINKRLGNGVPFSEKHLADVEIYLDEKMLLQPLRWKRPRRIFLNSMSDTFGAWVTGAMLDRMYAVMALCPQHEFVVLTKRAERLRFWTTDASTPYLVDKAMDAIDPVRAAVVRDVQRARRSPFRNVTTGVSCEDQPTADERIPNLLAAAADRRIVSLEPLLGPVNILPWIHRLDRRAAGLEDDPLAAALLGGTMLDEASYRNASAPTVRGLDGVIVGGESGRALAVRPIHQEWVRVLRDQCVHAGVPFFFKQWGEWLPWSQFNEARVEDDEEITRYDTKEWRDDRWHSVGRPMWCDSTDGAIDNEQCVGRVGKKAAGAILDGREHREWPT